MTVEIACPWCEEPVALPAAELERAFSCRTCGIRVEFAPEADVALAEAA